MEAADPSTLAGRSQQFEADFQFHEAVARAAQMPRLLTSLHDLWIQARALLHQLDTAGLYPSGDEVIAVRDDHRAMLNALLARDPAEAADAVGQHLESRARVLVEAVRRHGGLIARGNLKDPAGDKVASTDRKRTGDRVARFAR